MKNDVAFNYPAEYTWLVERKIAGFGPFTQLQPWYFTPEDQSFWATEHWKTGGKRNLYVFARRQDNDELACFAFNDDDKLDKILIIQGWMGNEFEVLKEFSSFWDWFKYLVDDIADWINPVA